MADSILPRVKVCGVRTKDDLGAALPDAAGIVLGARIPIILTSRADSKAVRIASCAVGALYAHRLAGRA